jgi:hypothetical protein
MLKHSKTTPFIQSLCSELGKAMSQEGFSVFEGANFESNPRGSKIASNFLHFLLSNHAVLLKKDYKWRLSVRPNQSIQIIGFDSNHLKTESFLFKVQPKNGFKSQNISFDQEMLDLGRSEVMDSVFGLALKSVKSEWVHEISNGAKNWDQINPETTKRWSVEILSAWNKSIISDEMSKNSFLNFLLGTEDAFFAQYAKSTSAEDGRKELIHITPLARCGRIQTPIQTIDKSFIVVRDERPILVLKLSSGMQIEGSIFERSTAQGIGLKLIWVMDTTIDQNRVTFFA